MVLCIESLVAGFRRVSHSFKSHEMDWQNACCASTLPVKTDYKILVCWQLAGVLFSTAPCLQEVITQVC